MKKTISIMILMVALLTGCTPATKITTVADSSRQMPIKHKTVTIAKVINYGENQNIPANAVLASEFSNNGFTVLERDNFDVVVDEYAFDSTVGRKRLINAFKSSDYVVVAVVTKANIYDKGQFYLIYNDFNKIVNIRVVLKVINTQTGEAMVSDGEATGETHTVNFLIFGGYSDNENQMIEDTFRAAVSSAVKKLSI